MVIFIISLIIPYRETVDLSITICSEPEAEVIKATANSKIIVDTSAICIEANSIIAYEQTDNKIYPIYSRKGGNIAASVKNGQTVKKNEVIFIIIPSENYSIYGISDVSPNEAKNIKKGQQIAITIDTTNIQGTISDIYKLPISAEQNSYRIKIDIEKPYNLYPQSVVQGVVTISEKKLFEKIFM
jgi:hypothetical protein